MAKIVKKSVEETKAAHREWLEKVMPDAGDYLVCMTHGFNYEPCYALGIHKDGTRLAFVELVRCTDGKTAWMDSGAPVIITRERLISSKYSGLTKRYTIEFADDATGGLGVKKLAFGVKKKTDASPYSSAVDQTAEIAALNSFLGC